MATGLADNLLDFYRNGYSPAAAVAKALGRLRVAIMIVDDDQYRVEAFTTALTFLPGSGAVYWANTARDAYQGLLEHQPRLLFLDRDLHLLRGREGPRERRGCGGVATGPP
jgi:hypothetical protein